MLVPLIKTPIFFVKYIESLSNTRILMYTNNERKVSISTFALKKARNEYR